MKFEIDRNSWHYKLNTFHKGYHDKLMFEKEYPDFCSYWKVTIFNLFAASIAAGLLLVLFGLPIYTIISQPLIAALFVFMFVITAGVVFLIQYLFSLATKKLVRFLNNREHKKELKQTKEPFESLFKQKLYAWKHKYCATVSYK